MDTLLSQLEKMLSWKKSKQYYADTLGISVQEVEELIKQIRNGEESDSKDNSFYSESIDYDKNTKNVVLTSDKPLQKNELEELAGIDNITSYLRSSWLKSHKNNTWTYSLNIGYLTQDFYTKDELKTKLQSLFPKTIQKYNPIREISSNRVLIVYIGDDHCGLVLQQSMYGNEQSEEVYAGRLDKIVSEIVNLNQEFDKICIVSLGDELDGYNQMTTRGGHNLGSLSNKEQFDIYVDSRRAFYDKLFTLDLANSYLLINQNNSNHSGNHLSYMANKALELYLEQRYDNVYILQTEKLIQVIEIGNHVFGFVHGKDEKHQKSPLPLNLDAKTDAYLFEFYDKQGYSPSRNWISTIKADIHKYNVNIGKHGRYVNIPSISSGSNWIEANFGNSKPGALLEIVQKDKEEIISLPIWF